MNQKYIFIVTRCGSPLSAYATIAYAETTQKLIQKKILSGELKNQNPLLVPSDIEIQKVPMGLDFTNL